MYILSRYGALSQSQTKPVGRMTNQQEEPQKVPDKFILK